MALLLVSSFFVDICLLAAAKAPGLAIEAPDGASFADVNGAILAIAFAAITGYALIVFQSLDRMLHELVDKANNVVEQDRVMTESPEASLANASGDDLLAIVQKARLGSPIELGPGEEISATELARRGRVFVWGMQKLFFEYPFSHVQLVTESDVSQWLKDLEPVVVRLEGITQERLGDGWAHIVRAADEVEDANIDRQFSDLDFPNPPSAAQVKEWFKGSFSQSAQHYAERAAAMNTRKNELRHLARRMELYRQRVVPSRKLAATIGAALVAVFGCGVAIPMLNPDVCKVVSAWIPVGIYTAGIAAAGVLAWKQL